MPHIGKELTTTTSDKGIMPLSQRNPMEKLTLAEYLNEDASMSDTIDNLEQLLSKLEEMPKDTVCTDAFYNIQRALYSLTTLRDLVVAP